MSGPRVLVVRRDNIGDLVCTTPLIAALRAKHPAARIAVLANAYNAPVLAAHPDIDTVHAYRKRKHGGVGLLGVVAERVGLLRALRREAFDYVVLAKTRYEPRQFRFVQLAAPRHIVGYAPMDGRPPQRLDHPIPDRHGDGLHEVERVFRLASALGVDGGPPAARLGVDREEAARVSEALKQCGLGRPLIGMHLSARKPSQRWPAERYAALMQALRERADASFMLFWSPGPADHPQHPGDDDKADAVRRLLGGRFPVLPWTTAALPALVAGIAACDRFVCADGGAMHIAAALGKPILCFFGDSDAARWHPWNVPFELLQPASRNVADVSVADALAGWDALSGRLSARPGAG